MQLYAWIDTAEANYPSTLVGPTHELLLGWVGQVSPYIAGLMWTDAMSMRLGTVGQNLTVEEVLNVAYNDGFSFESLFALPEQDRWEYYDGSVHSYDIVTIFA